MPADRGTFSPACNGRIKMGMKELCVFLVTGQHKRVAVGPTTVNTMTPVKMVVTHLKIITIFQVEFYLSCSHNNRYYASSFSEIASSNAFA